MIERTTFGSGKSALKLAEILNEFDNPTYNRRVTNFLVKQNRLVKALESIPWRAERLALAYMLIERANAWLPKGVVLPDRVLTFSRNVAISTVKSRIFDMAEDMDFEDWLSR